MNLNQRKKEFDHRHDFDDEDLKILQERHPGVEIKNIPTAWIVIVDELLCAFRYNNAITSVEQHFGHLCVSLKNRPEDQGRFKTYRKTIAHYEEKIRAIDLDLNKE